MVERLHAETTKRAIAIADASQRWGSHITRVNGLIALQAQDIVDEVIGLRGRDDEVGHVAMAGLKEHFSESAVVDARLAIAVKSGGLLFAPAVAASTE